MSGVCGTGVMDQDQKTAGFLINALAYPGYRLDACWEILGPVLVQ